MKKSSFLGKCFKLSSEFEKPGNYHYTYFGYCFCFDLDQDGITLYYNASKKPDFNLKGLRKQSYTSSAWKSFMQNRKPSTKEFGEEVKVESLLTHKDKRIRDWAKEIKSAQA